MIREDNNNIGPNDAREFDDLSEVQRVCLLKWIDLAMQPAKSLSRRHATNSYALKHAFEYMGGFYVANGAFKGAMLRAGYQPVDTAEMNWRFRVKPRRISLSKDYGFRDERQYAGYGLDQLTPEQRAEYLAARRAVPSFTERDYYPWLGDMPGHRQLGVSANHNPT